MTGIMILLCLILIIIVVVQVGKVSELAGGIRGEEAIQASRNAFSAKMSMVFLVLFLIGCVWSSIYYAPSILWYGPHVSASEHGGMIDSLFNTTLFFTGIVFVITHILLFYFAYKYSAKEGRRAKFLAHDTKLEIVWTVIPAVTMCYLVIQGLVAWNVVMTDTDEYYVEIEATGQQFYWTIRYPGADNVLGTKYFRNIGPTNDLGMDWSDEKSHDDVISSGGGEIIKIPLGKEIRVRITAKDVLHNFDLPHFRVKMDAIPGLPTYFKFTPAVTTEQYRKNLSVLDEEGNPKYAEWHILADPEEPDGPKRWEAFQYELACAELCGKGHYSMRRYIEVVTEEEWLQWMAEQNSYYMSTIRNTDDDPYKGQLIAADIKDRSKTFRNRLAEALAKEEVADRILRFDYVNFQTGNADLTENSQYELGDLVNAMSKYPGMTIEVAGHTDNVGDAAMNFALSNNRAQSVYQFLLDKGISASRMTAKGYGDTVPVDAGADNNDAENRKNNRRTEFKILTK
ncbi:MAG: cytochrome c oxidase subunit 2 [Polaribacter sp.]|jgi:cytochrome c oxidase subunit 2